MWAAAYDGPPAAVVVGKEASALKPDREPIPAPLRVSRRQFVWYFVVPMATSGVLIAMYFSGVRLLETLVAAPYFDAVPPNSRREFGLLETIQHGILLAASVIAARAAFVHRNRLSRVLMGVVAAVVFLLLLEEIDYGLHYYEYLAGVPHEETAQVRNLHNVGDRTDVLKTLSLVGMLGVFVVAPLALRRSTHRWVRYLTPEPAMALTLLVAIITRTVVHSLKDRGLGFGLEGNLSEFRELVMYYLGLMYTIYLARREPGTVSAGGSVAPRAG